MECVDAQGGEKIVSQANIVDGNSPGSAIVPLVNLPHMKVNRPVKKRPWQKRRKGMLESQPPIKSQWIYIVGTT